MAGGENCINRIVQMSNGLISQPEAEELINNLTAGARKRIDAGDDMPDALRAEVEAMKNNIVSEGFIQKRNTYINIIKKAELENRVSTLIAEGIRPDKAIESITVGIQGRAGGTRRSVDFKQKALKSKYIGSVVKELEENDLLPLIQGKALDKEVARELWELSLPEGKAGKTGSKEAKKIADILHKYLEDVRIRQNNAGADIGKVEGFIGSQSHDMLKLRKAGYEKWRSEILPLLDNKKTFDADIDDTEKFLRGVYDGLASGRHLKTGVDQDDKLFQFKGPSNLAKRMSSHRKLHFKDADSWLQYNNKFGHSRLFENIMHGLERGSQNIALLETFGTNPRAMFDNLRGKIADNYRDQPAMVNKIMPRGGGGKLLHQFEVVDGTAYIAENPSLANVSAIWRAIQSMSKLGMVLLSALGDIPLKARALQLRGDNFFSAYTNSIFDVVRGKGKKGTERRGVSNSLQIGFDGIIGNVLFRFHGDDDLNGAMSSLMRKFFKYNGLTWWTDSHKAGMGLMLSNDLAKYANVSLDNVPTKLRNILENAGITSDHWEALKLMDMKGADGKNYMVPNEIHNVPNEDLLPILKKITGLDELSDIQILNAKNDIEDRLQGYILDSIDEGVITPDAKERAILRLGTKKGTLIGEAIDIITQFKAFPTTVITKMYGSTIHAHGKADMPLLVQTSIMLGLFGYMSMSLKDIAKGREPRDPTDPKVWLAAWMQGGGGGIYGDYLLGEYNRHGQKFTSSLLGPSAGTLDDFARVFATAGRLDDPSSAAFRLLSSNTPFMNLFYVRPALNYLFLYQLQEMISPGSLRRMEKRVKKENNQEYFIKPSQIAR